MNGCPSCWFFRVSYTPTLSIRWQSVGTTKTNSKYYGFLYPMQNVVVTVLIDREKLRHVDCRIRASNFLSPCFDYRRANGIITQPKLRTTRKRCRSRRSTLLHSYSLINTAQWWSTKTMQFFITSKLCANCCVDYLDWPSMLAHLVNFSEHRISFLPASTIDEPMELWHNRGWEPRVNDIEAGVVLLSALTSSTRWTCLMMVFVVDVWKEGILNVVMRFLKRMSTKNISTNFCVCHVCRNNVYTYQNWTWNWSRECWLMNPWLFLEKDTKQSNEQWHHLVNFD